MIGHLVTIVAGAALAGLAVAVRVGDGQVGDGQVSEDLMTTNEMVGVGSVEEVGRVHPEDGRMHVAPLATPGTTAIDLASGRRRARAEVRIVRLSPGAADGRQIGGAYVVGPDDRPQYALVDIQVRVNGCEVLLPSADPPPLGDPHGIALSRDKRTWILSFWGSDAAESYRLTYRFDDRRVTHRRLDFGGVEEALYTIDRDDYGEGRNCKPVAARLSPAEARRPDAVLATNH